MFTISGEKKTKKETKKIEIKLSFKMKRRVFFPFFIGEIVWLVIFEIFSHSEIEADSLTIVYLNKQVLLVSLVGKSDEPNTNSYNQGK